MGINLTEHLRDDMTQLFDYSMLEACVSGKVYRTLHRGIHKQRAYARKYETYPELAARLIPFMNVSEDTPRAEVMKEVIAIRQGQDKTFLGVLQSFFVRVIMRKKNRDRIDGYIKKQNQAAARLYLATEVVETTKEQVRDCVIYLIDDDDYNRVVDENGINPFHEMYRDGSGS